MRIGIDATALPPNPAGAGKYTIQLIRAFSQLLAAGALPGVEICIFVQRQALPFFEAQAVPGLEWIALPDYAPARRLVWEQTAFPRLVAQSGVELLHGLHYTRPWRLPCRSVITLHDMTFFLFPELHTRAKRLYFPPMIRLSAQKAEALIAVSESTRQDAIRILNLPPEKIHTVMLGVTEEFRPISDQQALERVRQAYHLPDAFVLFVGTIEPRKNLPALLQAYARLPDAVAPPLVIAGGMGWGYECILQQIDSLGLQERVVLTGYVADADLPIVYNLARLFVYPSTYEGFGLPPLEAMACGTPVITTRVSSMPEHVGEAGIL
ncbi:MAG TPA: glycosyltransferase family 1 protein, partial [Anaerolineales bacterium]|nr:glycosyltransferase family 1 protein [Anaerolineales bacterium]